VLRFERVAGNMIDKKKRADLQIMEPFEKNKNINQRNAQTSCRQQSGENVSLCHVIQYDSVSTHASLGIKKAIYTVWTQTYRPKMLE
jgi:hypothetical protein